MRGVCQSTLQRDTPVAATLLGMEVGERWAFRRNRHARWAEVEVRKVGTGRPPRVRVEFVADEFEGKVEWVSPARLEVPWADFDEYDARDRRWKAFEAAPQPTDFEERAAQLVLWNSVDEGIAELSWTGLKGALLVHDVPALAAAVDRSVDELAAGDLMIVEGGVTWLPWEDTLDIIRALAPIHATKIFQDVEAQEREIQKRSVIGDDIRLLPSEPSEHVSGEVVARHAEEHEAPVFALVREWVGEASVARDELVELRREVARVGSIAQRAIAKVRALRSHKFADALEHELLNPPLPYPGHGEDSDRVQYESEYHWVRRDGNTVATDGRNSSGSP